MFAAFSILFALSRSRGFLFFVFRLTSFLLFFFGVRAPPRLLQVKFKVFPELSSRPKAISKATMWHAEIYSCVYFVLITAAKVSTMVKREEREGETQRDQHRPTHPRSLSDFTHLINSFQMENFPPHQPELRVRVCIRFRSVKNHSLESFFAKSRRVSPTQQCNEKKKSKACRIA